ncbi:MAG: putative gluconate dehydrogenase [Dehalococcoidia bacterium]|nr:putative gluconate dehydrogenase [Dehalococcoidia bacterium]
MGLEMFSLKDRVAIVTGGGRGIGQATALGLSQAGAKVVVAARTESEIEETASQIRAQGGQALAVSTDVVNEASIDNLVKKTLAKFGQIDILVNNAGGVMEPGGALTGFTMTTSGEAWDSVLRKNLKSAFLCSKAVAKSMIERRRGSIINIGSMSGLHADPPMTAYGIAKAGVIHLTKNLSKELGGYQIRVNCICPGLMGTPRVKHRVQLIEEKDPGFMQKAITLGRLGAISDLVGAMIFFASDASSYVTGEILGINGGFSGYTPPQGPGNW